MELFVEMAISLVYFFNYYQLFVYEISSKDIWNVFLLILLHLLTESCQSIIRFSNIYFCATRKIYSQLQRYYDNNTKDRFCTCRGLLSLLLNVFEDDSDLNEWRIRLSIDSSIRCISHIGAFSFFVLELFIYSYQALELPTKQDYYFAILYCAFSFSCDLIYFLFIFLFNYFNNYFNIWEPLVLMYAANKNVLLGGVFVSILFAFYACV